MHSAPAAESEPNQSIRSRREISAAQLSNHTYQNRARTCREQEDSFSCSPSEIGEEPVHQFFVQTTSFATVGTHAICGLLYFLFNVALFQPVAVHSCTGLSAIGQARTCFGQGTAA